MNISKLRKFVWQNEKDWLANCLWTLAIEYASQSTAIFRLNENYRYLTLCTLSNTYINYNFQENDLPKLIFEILLKMYKTDNIYLN